MLRRSTVAQFVYWLVEFVIESIRLALYGRAVKLSNTSSNIILVRRGSLGDNIATLPLVKIILNNPENRLTIIGSEKEDSQFSIASLHPDKRISYISLKSISVNPFFSRYRELFANAVLLYANQNTQSPIRIIRDILIFRILGIRKSAKITVQTLPSVAKLLEKDTPIRSEFESQRLLSVYYSAPDGFVLDPYEQPRARAATPVVVVGVGASISIKRWPVEHFVTIIEWIASCQVKVILLGSREDRELFSEEVIEKFQNNAYVENLVGETTVSRTRNILQRVDIVLSNDSALAHLAALEKVPHIVSIFSSWTLKGKWNARRQNIHILRSDVECSPCYRRACTQKVTCINLIEPDEVRDLLTGLLNEKL